jgi:N-acetylglucosamine-6-phosphate deacetylase
MTDGSLVVWGAVLTGGRELPPSRIEIRNGRITSISAGPQPADADLVVESGWIAPGLIDLQVNGAGGVDLTSTAAPRVALEHVARTLAAHGVTAFCPTIVSSPEETIRERLPTYAAQLLPAGAESLGAHIEGPFIDQQRRGVHDPNNLRRATTEELERWLAAGKPAIVTLAPELPGALPAIRQLAQAGTTVSLGHSGAGAHVAQVALAAGARVATHLFNAMPPLHHREPGLVGALLASDAALGIITDGVHLHPLIVDLVVRRAGVGRAMLVSDALAAAGAPRGPSQLGHQVVVSDGTSVRRADGTLAGSALLLDACLRNARAWLPDMAAAEVLRMATQTPAELLGLGHKGRVEVGADADLIVLDEEWRVQRTLVRGEVIHNTVVSV